jgi:hypothetical protein
VSNDRESDNHESVRKRLPLILGIVALANAVLLLVQDAAPRLLPAVSHDFPAALSLSAIACAYLVLQFAHRRGPMDLAKAILLAAAFLFWAANQFWPNQPQAGLFNDIAIGLFVLDVFFVIAGWSPAANDSVFSAAEESKACRCERGCGCVRCG